MIAAATTWK